MVKIINSYAPGFRSVKVNEIYIEEDLEDILRPYMVARKIGAGMHTYTPLAWTTEKNIAISIATEVFHADPERDVLTVKSAAIMHENIIYSIPRPGRHCHVIEKIAKLGFSIPIKGEQGFLLSDGTFVNRASAAQVALAAGQCDKLVAPPNLYSEDIW